MSKGGRCPPPPGDQDDLMNDAGDLMLREQRSSSLNYTHTTLSRSLLSRMFMHIPLLSRILEPWTVAAPQLGKQQQAGADSERVRALVFESMPQTMDHAWGRRQGARQIGQIFTGGDEEQVTLFHGFKQKVSEQQQQQQQQQQRQQQVETPMPPLPHARGSSRSDAIALEDHDIVEIDEMIAVLLESTRLPSQRSQVPSDCSAAGTTTTYSDDPDDTRPEQLASKRERSVQLIRLLEDKQRRLAAEMEKVEEWLGIAVTRRDTYDTLLAKLWRRYSLDEGEGSGSGSGVSVDNLSNNSDDEDQVEDLVQIEDAPRLRRLETVLAGQHFHYGDITALDYEEQLGLVVSGGTDTFVQVWDAVEGSHRYTIQGHSDVIRAAEFYNNRLVTASHDSRIRIWDLSLLDSVQPQPASPLSRDNGEDGGEEECTTTTPLASPTIYRYVPPIELCCESTLLGHNGPVTCMQTSSGVIMSGGADGTIREWDITTGQLVNTISLEWATEIGPSGDSLFKRLRLQAAVTGHNTDMCLHRFTVGLESGDGGYIGALQFFGSALITGTADGVVRLWDRRTGQSHRALRDCGHSDSITCLQFDDNYIISGSLDCSAVIWDLRASRALDRLKLASPITSLQLMHYLPPHLAASLNTDHTGTGAVTVPSSTLQSLQQKTLIWLAARDESIHSWNPNTFEHISYTSDHGLSDNNRRYLQSGPAALPGATPTVTRIRAIDGRNKIITAASDGIKIWDV